MASTMRFDTWENPTGTRSLDIANATPGLTPIYPTSTAVGSGSASTNAIGTVTFTGVSSISLNGIFTSSYKNYKILISASLNTAAQTINLRMRNAGVDNSGTYVFGYNLARISGTSAIWALGSSTYGGAMIMNSGASGPQTTAMDLFNPAVEVCTTWNSTGYWADSTSAMGASGGGLHAATSTFDGMSIFPNGGTITGTITVYGYNG